MIFSTNINVCQSIKVILISLKIYYVIIKNKDDGIYY